MRVALLTEGGYPFARGESVVWCDRLLRGLEHHEFDVYALSRSARQEEAGRREAPGNVRRVRTAPLWGDAPLPEGRGLLGAAGGPAGVGPVPYGRRQRRLFTEHFADLAAALCAGGEDGPVRGGDATAQADRFAAGLYGLADLAAGHGGLPQAFRSETAVRVLEAACRAPGSLRAAHPARVEDLLVVVDRLERALRPLSLDWYGEDALAAADLCHAVGGGPAALPGLLAHRAYGTPLLLTEYGVRLREHYLASTADAVAPAAARAPVRALLASFQGRLAREVYTRARLITPGNAHARRWQQRCGAQRERQRTVYPGMDESPFTAVGEQTAGHLGGRPASGAPPTLVWVGRVEPGKDLISLLHAFAAVHREEPGARLRLVETGPGRGEGAAAYGEHCRALAAQLFPAEAPGHRAPGENPVAFTELGAPDVPDAAAAYASGEVVVLSSVAEGFPSSLVEAMFCGRATVSTDVGAVCEVIGGTGLVVPPRNPRALADACLTLLRDPERRARLGAAGRARALELFTVEQNVDAFRGIYLELMSHWPVRRGAVGPEAGTGEDGGPVPFGRPPEAHVPGRWAVPQQPVRAGAAAGDTALVGEEDA